MGSKVWGGEIPDTAQNAPGWRGGEEEGKGKKGVEGGGAGGSGWVCIWGGGSPQLSSHNPPIHRLHGNSGAQTAHSHGFPASTPPPVNPLDAAPTS